MKRFYSVLALLLMITMLLPLCFACDTPDEESSSDESGSSQTVSGTEDESSEPEKELIPVKDPEYATVISLSKPYNTMTTAGEKYPDTYGIELTDGKKAPVESADYNEASYSGYHGSGYLVVTVDLGQVYDKLYGFTLSYLSTSNAGLRPPTAIDIMVSEDGVKFDKTVKLNIPEYIEGQRQEATIISEYYYTARYVRFAITKSAWLFIDEIEVIADCEMGATANEIFGEMVAQSFKDLGLVDYEGGNAPNKDIALQLVSYGASYTASKNLATGFGDSAKYLTDGKITGLYDKGNWVGYEGGEALAITVDLGSVRDDLSVFRLNCYSNTALETFLPVAVTYAVSEDNVNFTDIGRIYAVTSGQSVYDFPLALSKCATGRYVRFTLEATETKNYIIEEAAVYAYTGVSTQGSIFPPVILDGTEKNWDITSNANINLIEGVLQQILIPEDIVSVTATNISSHDTPVLTDGKKATSTDIHNGQYFKFQCAAAPIEMFFDLGATSAVKSFTAEFTHQTSWGVQAPNEVIVYLSMDGKEWYSAGTAEVITNSEKEIVSTTLKLNKSVKARFVSFNFFACNWIGVSELEVFGTTSLSGAKALSESGLKKRGEDSLGYLEPSKDILNGAKDLCLLYHGTNTGYNVEKLIPYLAYVDEDENIKDTMFDSFLFLLTGAFPSGTNASVNFKKSDLEWTLTDLFTEGENILALEEAAGIVKDALNLDDDFKYGFTVTLYMPKSQEANFGDIDGDGANDSMTTPENRLKAVEWYMEEFEAKLAEYDFKNIEFVAYYWYHESVAPENGEPEFVQNVSKAVHKRGYDFFWIPWYCASGFESWKENGFDATCMQPNYVFDEKIAEGRLPQAANYVRYYGMGIEIEIGSTAMQNPVLYNRYLEYLASGTEYGYMNNCIHMYYQELFVYHDAAKSGDPRVRLIYDYTYQFIKGTLKPSPDQLETVSVSGNKGETITGSVLEVVPGNYTFDIVASPEYGTVSLANDGSFTYYADSDYVGEVKFSYVYNAGMSDSEVCEVIITIE